jgi:hypothetical protein
MEAASLRVSITGLRIAAWAFGCYPRIDVVHRDDSAVTRI